MPYGYFILVRFIMLVAFGGLAYRNYVNNKTIASMVFGVLALLFQPIYKIALGWMTWKSTHYNIVKSFTFINKY